MTPSRRDPAFAVPAAANAIEPSRRPSFSVVVAVYRAADVVGAAIRSALAQTEPPLEVLVADDGSTDDLTGALAPFGDSVRRLRLPHQGAASATNAAAALATGDFVVVLDADDTWHPRRLERLADLAAERSDLDLLTTDAWFMVDGSRRGRFYDYNAFATTDQSTEILWRTFFFAHVAVRRTRWEMVGGFTTDLARGYDWDLQLRLLLSGSSAGCVLEPLADYTIHPHSLSANRYESLMARVALLDRAKASQLLSDGQAAVLEAARENYRRRALAARAEETLMSGARGRRRAALAALAAGGVGRRRRALLAAAVVAPTWVGARVRHEAIERGRARSDRVVG
ncbi:MAG: glycosyltransferase family 2 protein [Nocardioidaceae bacterium]